MNILSIPAAVALLRERLGLDQAPFGNLFGRSVPTVQGYIKGTTPPPTEVLCRLYYISKSHKHDDLAEVFRVAALADIPPEVLEVARDAPVDQELRARTDTEVAVLKLLRIPEHSRTAEEQFAVGMITDLIRRLNERAK